MTGQVKNYVTPSEHLAAERSAEYKNEYFDGRVFPMIGASRRHNLISGNFCAGLRARFRGRECEVYLPTMRVSTPGR